MSNQIIFFIAPDIWNNFKYEPEIFISKGNVGSLEELFRVNEEYSNALRKKFLCFIPTRIWLCAMDFDQCFFWMGFYMLRISPNSLEITSLKMKNEVGILCCYNLLLLWMKVSDFNLFLSYLRSRFSLLLVQLSYKRCTYLVMNLQN